jgi:hypothetical protein
MSECAYFRFISNDMLTDEEKDPENKEEIVSIVEEVEKAEGIEWEKRTVARTTYKGSWGSQET